MVDEKGNRNVKSSSADDKNIILQTVEDEMKRSYLDYAMSVIIGRALPDVKDGLKPVHRRILYAMNELSNTYNKPYKKCARIVGEVLGKYHPHGDVAVYDSLVRMAQEFSLRYPLVQGQGNFGSIDGDSAAAMRYTEARLAKISDEMLQDIDKETVDFTPNFDGTLKEPVVMPSKFPNLFINGSSGIAVGMATNIPPHNVTEMCNAVIATVDNPDIETEELLNIVKGPDFPTGAEILGRRGIIDAYNTGRGSIRIRSVIDIEEKKDRKRLVVREIPYQVNKAQLVESIAELVKDKKIPDISDLRDESDREGVRIVIELKRDVNPDIVKNMLYNYSRLEDSFGINVVALVNNEPKLLSLKLYLRHYVDHRIDVVRKRCIFDLRKAEERAHILEGLKIALKNIDDIIIIMKNSRSADEDAKEALMDKYKLSEAQSNAILEMKIRRLAMLEQEKINTEYDELKIQIKDLKDILNSDTRVRHIIKDEMTEIVKIYGKGDSRKTKIVDIKEEDTDFVMEDLIPDEPVVITMSHSGYVKRLPIETYKVQNRGGRGVIASDVKDDDYIEKLFVARTHSYLLIITNKGQLYWLKVYKVPDASRQSMGKAIVNLLELEADEKVNAIIPVKEFDDKHFLVMATKFGTIKKTNLAEFSNPRKGGIAAINLDDTIKDQLINVVMTDGMKDIMLATRKGIASRFSEEDVRATGRTSQGVRGIRLEDNDYVIGMMIAEDTHKILTLTENGYGKKTDVTEYRRINRGGKGVRNILCSERNGDVSAILSVMDDDEVMFISRKGILIRTPCDQISTVGRSTQGVRLIKLSNGDKAINMSKITK
jgi:DNA gyrase subunit A